MKPRFWLVMVFAGAVIGLVFAGVSTYDFVQHLDRQVHSLHCSFIPGGGHTGESGCQVAMMSSYSSVMRSRVWGGVPISLPAMAVFAFIGLFATDLLLTRRKRDPRATAFLALACALPAVVSLVMLLISLTQLGTTCKLCVCIYLASALCITGAIGLWRQAMRAHATGEVRVTVRRKPKHDEAQDPAWVGASREPAPVVEEPPPALESSVDAPAASTGFLAAAFGVGVAFVLVPVLLYLALAPDHGRFVGTCDGLAKPDDTYGVMVKVDHGGQGAPALEILDPLCPACKAFEHRLARSGYADQLDRKAILFPLDNTCNWMVTEATHPGACTVSEAVLCAGDRAPEVIAWAFEAQDQVRAETKQDPGAAARIVKAQFPWLASCVGSSEVRARLNKSLRWAVNNNIRVLTPQLYIDNVKLCDEDVDLGLEYSLRIMLDKHEARTLINPAAGGKPAAEATPHEPPPGDQAGDKSSDKSSSEKAGAGSSGKVTDKPSEGAGEKAGEPSGDKAGEKSSEGSGGKSPEGDTPPDTPAADKPPKKRPVDKPPSDSGDKPVTSPAGVDKGDKPVTSPSGADQPVTSPGGAP